MHLRAIIAQDRRALLLKGRGGAKRSIRIGRAIDNPAARLNILQ
jgi:hypothetical protein